MFTGKKLFLLGFIVLLLIGIPLTVYLVQQQQEGRSHATASTTLAFTPATSATAPKQANIGDSIPLDITVDPGSNQVTNIQLVVQYDPSKLEPVATDAFTSNTAAFPTIVEGPISTPGRFALTLSVGSDPTKAIQAPTKVGTITFKAIAATDATPATVQFGTETKVTSSAGPTTGSNDQAAENVLQSSTPAFIAVAGIATAPSPTGPVVSTAPSPTSAVIAEAPTVTPTIALAASPTPTLAVVSTATTAPLATDVPTAAPTMAATGPGDTIIGMGVVAGIITLVGAVILFAL